MVASMEDVLREYLEKHYPAKILFDQLQGMGNVYLIGGVLREIKDNGTIRFLRDIDIVLDTSDVDTYNKFISEHAAIKNRFGGYKVQCQDLIVDMWLLQQTWAYSEHVIQCDPQDYLVKLQETVFLNMDSIVYDIRNAKWYDDRYQEAMRTGILDVVLEDNPFLELNIIRSFVIKRKYDMSFSKKLKDIICEYVCNCGKENAILDLYNTQINRYKKEVLSKKELRNEIEECYIVKKQS